MRLFLTLFLLAFAQLFFNMAHASPHTLINANQHKADRNSAREDERRKRRPVKASPTKKAKEQPVKKAKQPTKAAHLTPAQDHKLTKKAATKQPALKGKKVNARISRTASKKKAPKKHYGRQRAESSLAKVGKVDPSAPLKLSNAHRIRYQKARETAVSKLMGQLGKPYLWGGSSPKTGFDCSGLVWYAYKDLVKFKIPRTANEMYHLRDAAPIKRDRLEKGDLVFFRINGRGSADHVGVYLGENKFIQSPRTGKDIQVSALSDDYWQEHYVGARRVMTPKTIR
ncbi:C40 family peptidase [Erwinia tasmaniensis]|uniref:NlpC/P60 domain-containing protein n=1 Tax=Erwinia tasmaniensis (strain DSM 17950 / CFBP 7177 / CIP 109463 / NCPPB 4357 / Et1/99) TaxID=465817 RepID=B2VEM4_ERWT9|nr:C40 family peptidase [Erwinia tasmaniensis]CAO96851.1 Hypothetical protein ETA_18050 [Erwinia tasmaniensis Et1/99]